MKLPTLKSVFTDVVVIYNPNSTGPGRAMAQELKEKLTKYKVRLIRTKYAGHAEELAYECAKASRRPLIISASGDGGYNEVVNGLMRAQLEGAKPTAGLLPAGNANDHYHDVHDVDLDMAISKGKTRDIDLLKLASTSNGKLFERYAHSYIGFGMTPKVGHELNKTDLNRLNEVWIVLKALVALHPVRVLVGGKRRAYDSLVFSNVGKMSKVLQLSDEAAHNDGKFEITAFTHRHKLRLLWQLIIASTRGLSGSEHETSYKLKTIKRTLVQMDGEVSTIDAGSDVAIIIAHKVLRCIV